MSPTGQAFADVAALVTEHGQFVSYPKAAEILNVSVRTLKRASESGELPAYRVGRTRTYRVKTADLAALLKQVS